MCDFYVSGDRTGGRHTFHAQRHDRQGPKGTHKYPTHLVLCDSWRMVLVHSGTWCEDADQKSSEFSRYIDLIGPQRPYHLTIPLFFRSVHGETSSGTQRKILQKVSKQEQPANFSTPRLGLPRL